MTRKRTNGAYRWLSTRLVPVAVAVLIGGCGDGADEHGHAHGHDADYVPAAHSHDDPDETCFICDPTKRDKGRLWCKEHGRYEDRCWLCHPEIEDPDRPYCEEHFLYEDECFLCDPSLKDDGATEEQAASHDSNDRGADTAAGGAEVAGLFCNEHGVPEIECGICQPQLAATLEPGGSLKVRMPSKASAERVGIRTDRPRVSASASGVEAFCEVQYNMNAMARVTPLAGGVIRRVHHDVGDRVEAGQVLVELHSPEVASVKSDYLSAVVERETRRRAYERERRLREQKIAAEKDYIEAEAAYRAAELAMNNQRQRLINLGMTQPEIDRIEREQDTSALLQVRAPFAGTLVERGAVVGEAAKIGDALFTIADLSSRWLILSVPSAHIALIHTGQVVRAEFDELPGQTIEGRITWIDTSVDPRTRMVRARAVVTEGADRITTGLFGRARVLTSEARPSTVVPHDAVQRHEGASFVFVQDEPDLFALRRVSLGGRDGDRVEVLAGLGRDDRVVTDGSFIVMSEFLKSRLGAGCVDH